MKRLSAANVALFESNASEAPLSGLNGLREFETDSVEVGAMSINHRDPAVTSVQEIFPCESCIHQFETASGASH